MNMVMPNLWLGSAVEAREVIEKAYWDDNAKVDAVINCCRQDNYGKQKLVVPDNMDYYKLSFSYTSKERIIHLLIAGVHLIQYCVDCKNLKTLVHCIEGKYRSVAVVLTYMCVTQGVDVQSAYGALHKLHPAAELDIFEPLITRAAHTILYGGGIALPSVGTVAPNARRRRLEINIKTT